MKNRLYFVGTKKVIVKDCWWKHHFQVNLEAKVALSSTVGGGLVEEAKSISADFLLLRGSRNKTNK
jgi:hypothetical protein